MQIHKTSGLSPPFRRAPLAADGLHHVRRRIHTRPPSSRTPRCGRPRQGVGLRDPRRLPAASVRRQDSITGRNSPRVDGQVRRS
jgi:hypothetical protein